MKWDSKFDPYKCPYCGEKGVMPDLTYEATYPIIKLRGKLHQCETPELVLLRKGFTTKRIVDAEYKAKLFMEPEDANL